MSAPAVPVGADAERQDRIRLRLLQLSAGATLALSVGAMTALLWVPGWGWQFGVGLVALFLAYSGGRLHSEAERFAFVIDTEKGLGRLRKHLREVVRDAERQLAAERASEAVRAAVDAVAQEDA
jgi:hypothetical protein